MSPHEVGRFVATRAERVDGRERLLRREREDRSCPDDPEDRQACERSQELSHVTPLTAELRLVARSLDLGIKPLRL